MRILYLTHYFPPEFGAAAARARSMTRWLARFGHEVTVITAFPNYLSGEIPQHYRGKRWVSEKTDGVTVYRTWLFTSQKYSNWRRMVTYLSFTTTATIGGIGLKGPYDVVIASSPPLFLGLAGVALARRFRAPLVFDVRDMWPEIAVKLEAFRQGSMMTRIWSLLAGFIYRQSAAIIPVTEGMRQDMIARGLPENKLHLVLNGVDLEFLQLDAPDLRQSLHLENKFVALFAGLIGVMQGVEILVEVAALLQDHPDIHLLIVGDGVRKKQVASKIRELHLKNINLLPFQSHEKIPGILNTANVCLAPLANDKVTAVIPYKMLEAWAYKRPVITNEGSEAGELVKRCEGGLTVPYENPQALANAIMTLAVDKEMSTRLGQNGHRCVEQQFNRQHLAKKMEKVLLSVANAQH